MRLIALLLLLIPCSLFSQKVEHETFAKIMRMEKIFVDAQTVKVDTLNRTEAKGQLNYQLAASLAQFLISDNRDTVLRLGLSCPNLIYLPEGTIIIYWDGDLKSFQGTFIQDRDHLLIQTVKACSRVFTIQQPVLSDSPNSEFDPNADKEHN
jgi:hypothetical protein